jgi:hypothetical protein
VGGSLKIDLEYKPRVDFVIIGAQKSGTTWLFECLDEHPEIFVPAEKELHYFCQEDDCRFSTKHKGIEWYVAQLRPGPSFKISGELTTDYMYYKYVVNDLFQINNECKIVALLRNPVDRAYSAYWMWRRHNRSIPTFEDMIRSSDNSLVGRGFYYQQLKPYFETFGADRVKVFILEEIKQNPAVFIAEIFRYLGVESEFKPKALHKLVADTKNYPPGVGRVVYKVISPLLNLRLIQPIWRYLRRNTNIKEKFLSTIFGGSQGRYPVMNTEDRLYLQERFREENDLLSGLITKNVNQWWVRNEDEQISD